MVGAEPASTRSARSAASRSRRSRSSWTASSTASRSTTRTRAAPSRPSAGTSRRSTGSFTGGFDGERHRQADRAGHARPGCRRDPAGRRPDLPERARRPSPTAATDTVMLGVDSDLAVADPSVADIVLVSIMKRIDVGRLRGDHGGRDRRVRRHAVRRHARERGRRPLRLRRTSSRSCPRAWPTSSPRCRSRSSRVSSR